VSCWAIATTITTKFYCLVTATHVCEQLARSRYLMVEHLRNGPVSFQSLVRRHNHYTTIVLLPLELFVYLCLIIGTLFLCISTHLTVLLLSNLVLNLIFLLLPITSSHSHASASDSTFDCWHYINISLTLTLTLSHMQAT